MLHITASIAALFMLTIAPLSLAGPLAVFDASGAAHAQTEPDVTEPVKHTSTLTVPSSGAVTAVDTESNMSMLNWSFATGTSGATLAVTGISAEGSDACLCSASTDLSLSFKTDRPPHYH